VRTEKLDTAPRKFVCTSTQPEFRSLYYSAFLIIMGVFAKFSAAIVSIPASVLGGMTTFLFCAVAVSGMAIINRIPFNRRTRFILTASLSVGYGATLVPT
jgi:xanthine/uracil permease